MVFAFFTINYPQSRNQLALTTLRDGDIAIKIKNQIKNDFFMDGEVTTL